MEAKDLMFGNYLRYKQDFPDKRLQGKVVKVYSFRGRLLDVVTIDDDTIHESVRPDWLEPIPTTPEILKKNGLLFDGIHGFRTAEWRENGKKEYSIAVCPVQPNNERWNKAYTGFSVKTSTYSIYCSGRTNVYVHDIQNALRLCGIDKQIKL